MVIYNVTIKIDRTVHEEWLAWMRSHHIQRYWLRHLLQMPDQPPRRPRCRIGDLRRPIRRTRYGIPEHLYGTLCTGVAAGAHPALCKPLCRHTHLPRSDRRPLSFHTEQLTKPESRLYKEKFRFCTEWNNLALQFAMNRKIQEEEALKSLRCYHCGTECSNQDHTAGDKIFCSESCRNAYAIIEKNGLTRYYEIHPHPGSGKHRGLEKRSGLIFWTCRKYATRYCAIRMASNRTSTFTFRRCTAAPVYGCWSNCPK
jgi:hypothetical protein